MNTNIEVEFKGVFEKVDEYGRVVIEHNDDRFLKYKWFKWKTKIIGKPSVGFEGRRFGALATIHDFKMGDDVRVKVSIIPCWMSTGSNRRILIHEMIMTG